MSKKIVTQLTVGEELLEILAIPQGRSGPLACCDRIDQDALFYVQDRLLQLAERMNGVDAVAAKFPFLYKTEKVMIKTQATLTETK